MQGRFHAYEGYSFEEVCFPLRVLRLLGCSTLIITNASGGVNLNYRAGDICMITDHIKFFMDSPLRGRNIPEFGVRFPDSTHLYTPRLQEIARTVAIEQGLPLQEGVYMYFLCLTSLTGRFFLDIIIIAQGELSEWSKVQHSKCCVGKLT